MYVESGGHSPAALHGPLSAAPSLAAGTRSRVCFSSFSAQAQQLQCTDLVAPQRVESPQTRDQTGVPCIGKGIL